ncbi:MAG TPA: tRNA (N(6)-L-threonylcarbamoyladenosine(37)-C(2))-methylthiotransferase MtaB [Elusimicrobiota bacterium]|nr:tRNA (N(6)-L-threonylcarbamoyladenosine(37)-C(2))-methylthiotransferase MtaB [Elusimicrobiota bacterium]
MRVYFKTFGCRVNQYETQSLRERVLADGSTATTDFESADLCLVNTCTVTREADKDALTLVRRIARRNPAARLVVTGCYATRAPEEVQAAAPAALVVSNDRREEIPALLGCVPVPAYAGISGFGGRARAFIKLQDGCNMSCTYCIIPSVRPDMSCRPLAGVLGEVSGLLERGFKEIVLCGIRLGRYLVEDEGGRRVDFVGLLERLSDLPGDFRVRLSSFEITDVTERLLDLFAARPERLCPSFHLPLQSGSDATLKRMRRWYSTAFYARRLEALRARLPDAAVFTDVMAGFPGETAADFDESEAFLRRMGFSGLHAFRYSKRSGTPAARWDGQVPDPEIKARAARLHALDGSLRAEFAASAVGRRVRVLVEKAAGGVEAMDERFLKVRLDRNPGPGLFWARVSAASGAEAVGTLDPAA